jgi:hypothetical protein
MIGSSDSIAGTGLTVLGAVLIAADLALQIDIHEKLPTILLTGAILSLVGAFLFAGRQFKIKAGNVDVESLVSKHVKEDGHILEHTKAKTLPPEVIRQRESYLEGRDVPGADAPRLSPASLALASDLLIRPSAYPMTPMYMLDKFYRIIDWNLAFTLAFDGTMEGRIGHSVLEWTYWLDNYPEVFDHGSKVFADENALPVIDREKLEFTSRRYGKIKAIKRAYQIPDDNGLCLAWLATLEMKFATPFEESDTKLS